MIKGILNTIGVKTEEALSPEEESTRVRHERLVMAWQWVRDKMDRAIVHYLETGDERPLEQLIEGQARRQLIEQLATMRAMNLRWYPTDRRQHARPAFEILEEQRGGGGQTTQFVIQESFCDYSELVALDASGREASRTRADGARRVIQSTVVCPGKTEFRVRDIRQVHAGV